MVGGHGGSRGVGGGGLESEEQPDESLDWTGKCMDELGHSTVQCIVVELLEQWIVMYWVDCTLS